MWNGDVGLIEETPAGLRALFSDAVGGVRSLSAGRLPSHESAIAMSVHKSQGSEWDNVLVIDQHADFWDQTRWRYTAATRAAKKLTMLCRAE